MLGSCRPPVGWTMRADAGDGESRVRGAGGDGAGRRRGRPGEARRDRRRPGDPPEVPREHPLRAPPRRAGREPARLRRRLLAQRAAGEDHASPTSCARSRGRWRPCAPAGPETLEYEGLAEPLQYVWVALRSAIRSVVEEVTIADLVNGKLPKRIKELVEEPERLGLAVAADPVIVHFLRHGESVSNAEPGRDLPDEVGDRLTERGRAQAAEAARNLGELGIDRALVEPAAPGPARPPRRSPPSSGSRSRSTRSCASCARPTATASSRARSSACAAGPLDGRAPRRSRRSRRPAASRSPPCSSASSG